MPVGLAELSGRLQRARRITVLTGAGVSAASGIPTFRGSGGLWNNVRAERLASAAGFAENPRVVWEWYDWRRQLISRAEPNAAHRALAAWMRARPGVTLITQNVDGLHERAGSDGVIGLHGSIWHLRCWSGCAGRPTPWLDETVPLSPLPPHCPACDGLARPAVVWFGEALDPTVLAQADDACHCDVFLSVGTSAIVYPAAGLVHEARARGAFTVEINAALTEATGIVDLAIQGPAEEVLPALAW